MTEQSKLIELAEDAESVFLYETRIVDNWWFPLWAITHPYSLGKMLGRAEVLHNVAKSLRALALENTKGTNKP